MSEQPLDGSIYGFKTNPLCDHSEPDTRRFAALKILGSNSQVLVIGVLDGIFDALPTAEQVRGLEVLRQNRFNFSDAYSAFGVTQGWHDECLPQLTFLTQVHVNREERRIADKTLAFSVGSRFGAPSAASRDAEGEWRWNHDRDALVAEQAHAVSLAKEKQREAEERYELRLRNLTWDQLIAETPLPNWTGRSPYPSEEFTKNARAKLIETMRTLQASGAKPPRKLVRAKLKQCVEWFNAADEAENGAIETDEREDICLALEEIAFVARQKTLWDEIDDWRTW